MLGVSQSSYKLFSPEVILSIPNLFCYAQHFTFSPALTSP